MYPTDSGIPCLNLGSNSLPFFLGVLGVSVVNLFDLFMRILHIITRLIAGGAQQNTVMSCAAQVAAGHDVTLAYGPIYGPEGSLLDDAKRSGARLIEVPSMRRSVLPGHDWFCYRALRKIIREVKPQVVHTHSSKAGILGRAAAWKEGVPAVIHTVHGSPFHEKQPWVVRRAYIAAERWAAKRCHRMVGITQPMVDLYLANRIGKPAQFSVIPSGVDLSLWSSAARGVASDSLRSRVRSELHIPENAPIIGLVARFDALKGHADLLRITQALTASRPQLHLLFVGDGFHRAAIERLASDLNLTDRIICTGLVPSSRVAECYRAMDVMVLPSYQEGQSRTLIESLLCGCPIVAYDTGGIREVCIEGVTGRLVPTGNLEAMREAIAWSLDHPRESQHLAEQGREHVTRKFDQRVMCTMLESLYQQWINRP